MARDIFGKEQEHSNTELVTSDQMTLMLPRRKGSSTNTSAVEMLVQNVQIQYSQPVNKINEIGSGNSYFAPNRSVGSCTIGRIIGAKSIKSLLGVSGAGIWTTDNVDSSGVSTTSGERTLLFFRKIKESVSNETSTLCFRLTGCVIETYAVSTNANGHVVQENVSMQFAGLEILDDITA